ncbi:MAG: hypothetical protein HW401_45 [Parcubacteria group bacterium]|nr:hypothetical protein [Parcubacteria group bacterium]
MDDDSLDPKEEKEEMPENIDEFILSELDDLSDTDEDGFGSGAFSSY